MSLAQRAIGAPLDRVDGPLKVTGAAKYAYEHQVDDVTYASPVQSSIARGPSRLAECGPLPGEFSARAGDRDPALLEGLEGPRRRTVWTHAA